MRTLEAAFDFLYRLTVVLLLIACVVFMLYVAATRGGLSAAPVPKQKPVEAPALTVEKMAGSWSYAWDKWPDGVGRLDRDGTYSAAFPNHPQTVYFGTWTVEGETVVMSEYEHDLTTNARSGPVEYRFTFKASDWPNLSGKNKDGTRVGFGPLK